MNTFKLIGTSALYLVLAGCGGGGGGSSSGGGGGNTVPVSVDAATTVQQDSASNSITLNASDSDGDTLTYSVVTQPTSGMLTLSGNVADYIPNAGFSGSDSFSFTANDGTIDSNVSDVTVEVQPLSSFSGKTLLPDGTPIPDVTIQALDASGEVVLDVTSGADGAFELLAVAEQALNLKLYADGYANQVLAVTLPDTKGLSLPLDVVMIARGTPLVIDIDAGGVVTGVLPEGDGASVTLTAGSFVDADGATVSGDISVTMTPVNVADADILAAFPGSFSGIVESSGLPSAIVSAGTVEYIFTQNGEPIDLASGQTADITLPIYSAYHPVTGDLLEAGDTIELWSLNEETGIWQQEGTGTVVISGGSTTGFALEATVSHFTWWNVDYPLASATVDVTVNGTATGTAGIIHARVDSPIAYRPANANISVGSTVTGLTILGDQTTCFWIEFLDLNGAGALSEEQCIVDAIAGSNYPLTFDEPVTGTLTLNDTVVYDGTYNVNRSANVTIAPSSLETMVTYTADVSTPLPEGLTLTFPTPTTALISGGATGALPASGTVTTITIDAVDDELNTDTIDIDLTFTRPSLPRVLANGGAQAQYPTTFEVETGATFSNLFLATTPNQGELANRWTILNPDLSAPPSNVSIANDGTMTIVNYDGVEAQYELRAFNSTNRSHPVLITINPAP